MTKKADTSLMLATLAICTGALFSQSAAAELIIDGGSYFVRPLLRVGNDLQDGLRQNGPVSATQLQGVQGYSESTVNLNDGTVKMYAESYDGLLNLQTFGSFGERLTFRGGAGTDWNFSFSIDGTLATQGGGPLLDGVDEPQWLYNVGLAVYRPGRADWSNFVGNQADANLYRFDQVTSIVNYTDESATVFADLTVSGTIPLLSNVEVFDIFAFTNVFVSTEPGDGLESFQADFLSTSTFSQTVAPDVEVFSSSGQFLGLQLPPPSLVTVPTPATAAMLGLGLFALGFSRRRSVEH